MRHSFLDKNLPAIYVEPLVERVLLPVHFVTTVTVVNTTRDITHMPKRCSDDVVNVLPYTKDSQPRVNILSSLSKCVRL